MSVGEASDMVAKSLKLGATVLLSFFLIGGEGTTYQVFSYTGLRSKAVNHLIIYCIKMVDGLRGKLLNFIEEHDEDADGNWTSDIEGSVISNYYLDILKAYREICDFSLGKNEDGSLYFLPFWIDTIGDEDSYMAAFTEIMIGNKHYTIKLDSYVKDDFSSVDEFVDTIVDLTEQAENVKNTFNLLRPIYNEQ